MKRNVVFSILLILFLFGCNQKKEKQKPKITFKVKEEPKDTFRSVAYGIDISKYQGDEISKLNRKTDSLSFIICKATEGMTYTDSKFSYNWKMIKQESFLRGAYHFYRSNDNPKAQASNFSQAIADIQKTDIPPIIDFEEGSIVDKSTSVENIQKALKIFINQIEDTLKCKPIIYTSINTGNKYLNDSFFADYPLWIANYNGKSSPDLPNAWKENGWIIWQKSATYKLDGITDDLDVFNGDLKSLKIFIKNSYYE